MNLNYTARGAGSAIGRFEKTRVSCENVPFEIDFDKLPLRLRNDNSIVKTQNSRSFKFSRALYYFLYTLFVALGLLLVVVCFNRIYTARQSLHWASVQGKIIWSSLIFIGKNGGVPRVHAGYRYSVNGVEYVGNDVGYGFGETFGESDESAEARVARYPAGATATVYYDPSAPERSCLETGGNLIGYAFPIGGGLVLIVFGVSGFWQLRRPKKES